MGRPFRRKQSTTERGYGKRHQALRAQMAIQVATGTVRCARTGYVIPPAYQPCPRCHKPMSPTGHAKKGWCGWDLGHRDGTGKQVYSGPELSCANRATAAHRKGWRKQSIPPRTSREW